MDCEFDSLSLCRLTYFEVAKEGIQQHVYHNERREHSIDNAHQDESPPQPTGIEA